MAYDYVGWRMIMFGGADQAGQELGDTWSWDGFEWKQLANYPSAGMDGGTQFHDHYPEPRGAHAMAADSLRKRVVMIGSRSSKATWEWDGERWINVAVAPEPANSYWRRFAYDQTRARMVLYDDSWDYVAPGQEPKVATWTWDGNVWEPLATETTPPGEIFNFYDGHLVYDRRIRAVSLYFPFFLPDNSLGGIDVWSLMDNNWILNQVHIPELARAHAAMASVENCEGVVLYGGDIGSLPMVGGGEPRTDMWFQTQNEWRRVSQQRNDMAPFGVALGYDPCRQRLVMFGGKRDLLGPAQLVDEVWEFEVCRDMRAVELPVRHPH